MPCPFCEITKEDPLLITDRTTCFVIFSNPRLMPGHLLVTPKRHIERPWEMTEEERKEVFDTSLDFQEKIVRAGIAPGCDIREHYRPFMPQSHLKIDHIHFHLYPRSLKDEFNQKVEQFDVPLFLPLEEEERKKIKGLLG